MGKQISSMLVFLTDGFCIFTEALKPKKYNSLLTLQRPHLKKGQPDTIMNLKSSLTS